MFDQADQNQQTQNATIVTDPALTMPVNDAAQVTPSEPMITSAPLPAEPVTSPALTNVNSFDSIPTPSLTPTEELVPAMTTPSVTEPDAPAPADQTAENSELLSIKQDALQSLSPLLSQLEQSPEEKFRTTMMLIQAADDQSLIQTAYSAAKDISDEKIRAQALLDIVNEINYFTQHKPEPTISA